MTPKSGNSLRLLAFPIFALACAALPARAAVTPPEIKLDAGGGVFMIIDSAGNVTYGPGCGAAPPANATCNPGTLSITPTVTALVGPVTIGQFTIGGAVIGEGRAFFGSDPTTTGMDIEVQNLKNTGSATSTLTVSFTDTNYPAVSGLFSFNTITSYSSGATGSTTYKGYLDTTNTPFGMGTLIGTIPNVTTNANAAFTATSGNPQSLTAVSAITLSPGGFYSDDFSLHAAPATTITILKTADSATVTPPGVAGFTVTISNTGTTTATGLTLSDPLPPGSGNDINWMIDTTKGNPASFKITGAVGSQALALSPAFIAGGDALAPGASLTVHITGATSINDASTFSSNPALNVGAIGGYTVLYEGTGGHNLQITNVSIGGNIGVGGTGHVQFNGPGTITGRLDFLAANTGQYSNNNSSDVGPTSVNYNVAAVTTALNAVNSLNSSLAGLGNDISFNNANQTVNESSGQLATVNGITYRIFYVTSYSENNGDIVTIHGDGSGDPVVFNFGFNNNVNLGGDVVLTGGLTPDQVIWNFTSSNQNIQLNNNQSSYPYPTYAYQGVILAPNDKLSLVNTSLIGRVFGGDSSDMQIVSGDNIHTPPATGTLPNTATVSAANVISVSATASITVN